MNRETIANIIGLRDQNFTNLTKTIETNVLEPLRRSGFIDSYSKTDGMKDVKFIIVRKESSAWGPNLGALQGCRVGKIGMPGR